jgi:hypothetical protein
MGVWFELGSAKAPQPQCLGPTLAHASGLSDPSASVPAPTAEALRNPRLEIVAIVLTPFA